MTTIRPSFGTFLIFLVIDLVICLPGIDALRLGQWQGVVFIMVGNIITVLPLSRFQISWNESTLIYRELVATRRVRFSDISKFDVHGPNFKNRQGPTIGIRIFLKSLNEPIMTINIKPFARHDIARLIEKLKEVTG